MSSKIIITIEEIRTLFKEFEDITTYPDVFIEMMIEIANNFISNELNSMIKETTQRYLIQLMVAHLIKKHSEMNSRLDTTDGGGIVMASSVGDVSVRIAIPMSTNAQEYWLNQTKYGQEYLALLATFKASMVLFFGTNNRVFRGNVR